MTAKVCGNANTSRELLGRVQGEAEYVERHAPEIGQEAPAMGQVRALEWTEYETDGWEDRADAEAGSFGVFYNIDIQSDGYRVIFDHEAVGAVGTFETYDEAKAAAQADYERRILAALTPSPGWQPIETAPRDGTAILASGLNHGKGPSRHYSVVEWMDFGCESGWYPDEDSEPHIYLTHWMPLPAAPEAEGGEDG